MRGTGDLNSRGIGHDDRFAEDARLRKCREQGGRLIAARRTHGTLATGFSRGRRRRVLERGGTAGAVMHRARCTGGLSHLAMAHLAVAGNMCRAHVRRCAEATRRRDER